jgi:hypothetical protein
VCLHVVAARGRLMVLLPAAIMVMVTFLPVSRVAALAVAAVPLVVVVVVAIVSVPLVSAVSVSLIPIVLVALIPLMSVALIAIVTVPPAALLPAMTVVLVARPLALFITRSALPATVLSPRQGDAGLERRRQYRRGPAQHRSGSRQDVFDPGPPLRCAVDHPALSSRPHAW